MTQWTDGFEAGERDARRKLKPLVEAINDTIFMFKDIEKARELPPFADVQKQYVAMGHQLERLLQISELDKLLD